jgi:hypothetical protein
MAAGDRDPLTWILREIGMAAGERTIQSLYTSFHPPSFHLPTPSLIREISVIKDRRPKLRHKDRCVTRRFSLHTVGLNGAHNSGGCHRLVLYQKAIYTCHRFLLSSSSLPVSFVVSSRTTVQTLPQTTVITMSSSSGTHSTGWLCFTGDSDLANDAAVLGIMKDNSQDGKFTVQMTTADPNRVDWQTDCSTISPAFGTEGYYRPYSYTASDGQTYSDMRIPNHLDGYCEPTWVTSIPYILMRLPFQVMSGNVRVVIPTDSDEFRRAAEPAEWVDTDDEDTAINSRQAPAARAVARATEVAFTDEWGTLTSCAADVKCEVPVEIWIGGEQQQNVSGRDFRVQIKEVLTANLS